jgi:4-alpha-glucanotransferase
MNERLSGVLMPMSSLPSPYGIGTMGVEAYRFVDFLKASGQSYWQLLPLGPTSYGDSPYQSFSTYAGSPYYVDLEFLIRDGLLTREEVEAFDWGVRPDRTDYGILYENRFKVLRIAFERGRDKCKEAFEVFRKENAAWVENYAFFMALKAEQQSRPWTEWPEPLKLREGEAMREAWERLHDEVDFYVFIQYLFDEQWKALRTYAHMQGIRFIGDIPIYVAMDSADVWSEPWYFQLNEKNVPNEVAGVPPDQFTADGQLWGNPLYNWDLMARDGYNWWIRRVGGASRLFDVIRIDHFRGIESYWAVPFGESTAKNGHWNPGPGLYFVEVLKNWFRDLRYIAEDLGYLTPDVKKMVADSGLPSMRVMEFAFDGHGDSIYLPHNCTPNTVCYMGTHDNDTALGWVSSLDPKSYRFAQEYMHITEDEGWCWGMIRSGMATSSMLFIVQMQDLLELGGEARMNTPGTASGNWQWRMLPGRLSKDLAKKLYHYTETYKRLPALYSESAEE